jgi:hypothetical protein
LKSEETFQRGEQAMLKRCLNFQHGTSSTLKSLSPTLKSGRDTWQSAPTVQRREASFQRTPLTLQRRRPGFQRIELSMLKRQHTLQRILCAFPRSDLPVQHGTRVGTGLPAAYSGQDVDLRAVAHRSVEAPGVADVQTIHEDVDVGPYFSQFGEHAAGGPRGRRPRGGTAPPQPSRPSIHLTRGCLAARQSWLTFPHDRAADGRAVHDNGR